MDRILVGRDEITIHVPSAETGGALLVGEVEMPAGGGPPALHRHPLTEVYLVDRGEFTIYLEDEAGELQRISATPRTVVHIPSGRTHTVRNESGAPAVAYVAFSPGAEMETLPACRRGTGGRRTAGHRTRCSRSPPGTGSRWRVPCRRRPERSAARAADGERHEACGAGEQDGAAAERDPARGAEGRQLGAGAHAGVDAA